MSTPERNFTDNFKDEERTPAPAKTRRQTPYKPRISTVVKLALEDSMREVRHAECILEDMVRWLGAERKRRDGLRARIATLAPLDHRMQTLLDEEKESLIKIGELDHMVALMSQSMLRLERHLSETIARSNEAVAPPRERKEERRQQ